MIRGALTRLLVLGLLGLLAGLRPAPAQTYLELAWFDRDRPDCFGFADPEARCTYDLRATIQLELPVFAELDWLRVLARSEVTANSDNPGEAGHVSPVKADLGGGLVLH